VRQRCSYVKAGLALSVLKTTRTRSRLRQRSASRRLFPSLRFRSTPGEARAEARCTLTDLVSDEETTKVGVRTPSEATELWQGPTGGRALLEVSRGPLELWTWTLEPGESHVSDAHRLGALELVKVRRGTLVLEVGHDSVQVKTGHTAWFDASRQHAYRNETTTPVTFTLVVFDPEQRT
jgi:quercetin dioxygenase-like cupin family protein